ncbi:tRNA uridine 5-carboxymethylaminomethyl modification enzyme [Caldicellulosiruptor bescii]|uniref:tRNA uridine 5-carboxymethylaminomethyl modification enzyme MnmG n=2 Tax=Caldicellulosiruptor bescii TaxID=31899 RepID=B9MQF2_CALBD|nr:tRNA uridine-5-carboxymethylaminomethyl(34) synthesis enzyme MnmG [Caldicellulosiruptor bescii]ACM61809.1 glucose inhibited division protein A [Caldicellulosiruptor bescii DSM 6725]PBC88392.1 tRNA uridine 5-carboxymethylaminomethyl modification enzyme [Caldicellulosiruptor bescii]PBC92127.1 tRNA uridine 5-carboxymethylaminomethyl modification enzyme [Caldicellulosiruptor bescii]PBD05063.1 tRNA uridine 5-carboxymethylaminomethyl modification enzyme [Caldicellulosiruptor bescii]PBD05306.1 tRN
MEFIAGEYDVAVVGAGHAGIEAALASARLGLKTIIFAINLDSVGNMPCNPSIGGTGKGHLVREIDALGGEMGKAADATAIQVRILNRAKGPAVYSLRAQCDRSRYRLYMKRVLENQENLDIRQAEVCEVLVEDGRVKGVKITTGAVFLAKAVVLATGTFLGGRVIVGETVFDSGPDGMHPARYLTENLKKLGIEMMRFKTGTPARVHRRSLDFSKMQIQPGDEKPLPFSFENEDNFNIEQVPCYLTYTTEETHRIIRENLHRAPLFTGLISGVGPRYCPSIEDKIVRFADKPRHQVFIEPTGIDTDEMYVQGMSTSLPEDVQVKMYRSVIGLENVKIMRPAYAIEYDCINPLQLEPTLQFKKIKGLFSAGQINGTSGYEEAAAQGIIAGINAAMYVKGKEMLILDRSQAYIGVLIDDLVTKGTNEPYRIMTSRAEYRLILRQDNADLRLTEIGYKIGLISQQRYEKFLQKKKMIEDEINRVKNTIIAPSEKVNKLLLQKGSSPISTGVRLSDLLKRPELSYEDLKEIDINRPDLPWYVQDEVEIEIKYEGYIKKQLERIEQFKKLENKKIPEWVDYNKIAGLSTEAKQKLSQIKPASIGQASRISGVSPADISVLLIWLETAKNVKKD